MFSEEEFQKLKSKAEKDLSIPDDVAIEQIYRLSASQAGKYMFYKEIYCLLLEGYENLKVEIEKITGEVEKDLKHGKNKQIYWKTQQEIDKQVLQDPKLYQKLLDKNKCKAQLDYVEGIVSQVQNNSFAFKNMIEIIKFKHGA